MLCDNVHDYHFYYSGHKVLEFSSTPAPFVAFFEQASRCQVRRLEMGECEARFAAAAARWPLLCGSVGCESGYDMSRYETSAEALEAYAAFHASKAADDTAKTLIFTPNQYGLGNRLRAMKSALLVAMLTGRVFRTWWHEPYPLDTLVEPARIDWRTPAAKEGEAEELGVICLPFATAEGLPKCSWHLQQLQQGDLRVSYAKVQRLEASPRRCQMPPRAPHPRATPRATRPPAPQVFTFTDLNIYLADNPHYEALLRRLGHSCPKRMGCLFDFMLSPGERRGPPHTCTEAGEPSPRGAWGPTAPLVLLLLLRAAGVRLQQHLDAVLPPRPPRALAAADTPAGMPGELAATELPAFGEYVAVQVRNRLWRCAPPYG